MDKDHPEIKFVKLVYLLLTLEQDPTKWGH